MIRVCPERDSRCPHGIKCPFVNNQYSCKEGWNEKEQVVFSTCRKEIKFETVRA